jgi:hypothetical protein
MMSSDELTLSKDDYCFAKTGEIYAVYLPQGGQAKIKIPDGSYDIQWFNPRDGGDLQKGPVEKITGGGYASTGLPPADPSKDWVCLIRNSSAL